MSENLTKLRKKPKRIKSKQLYYVTQLLFRYLLLTSKERKSVFDKYVRERADEERREKKSRLKEKKEAFRKLLSEAKLGPKSSYGDFSNKYGKDERFKGVDKSRDRESLFNEYVMEVSWNLLLNF